MKTKIISAIMLAIFILPGCHKQDPRKIEDLRSDRRKSIEKLDVAIANGLTLAAREYYRLYNKVPVSVQQLKDANLWVGSTENPWFSFNEERVNSNQQPDNRVYKIECYLSKEGEAPKKTDAKKVDAKKVDAKKVDAKKADAKKKAKYHFYINVSPLKQLPSSKAESKEKIQKALAKNRKELEAINKKIAEEKNYKLIEDATSRFFAK